jgi:phosphohistidine swiveling domain-containing protein
VTEPPNLLHMRSGPDVLWTTVNVAEASPGVHTPLGWSIWGELAESATAASTIDLGAWPRGRPLHSANADERFGAVFFGHYALNVNTFRSLGDRMPGSSGDAVEEQLFGAARSGMRNRPVRSRYPVVIARLPLNLMRAPAVVTRARAENARWWAARVLRGGGDPQVLLADACDRFVAVMRAHLVVTMLAQGAFEQLAQLCRRSGHEGMERALVGGYGGMEESALVADVGRLAAGARSEADFVSAHGFHGPAAGDVSSRSWREDLSPMLALVGAHGRVGGGSVEAARSALSAHEARERAERQLRGSLSTTRALSLSPLLASTRRLILGRETGKAAFLIALDGIRAAARSIGERLARDGRLAQTDDVFFLTLDELRTGRVPADGELAARRATYERYGSLELPETWQGDPRPRASDVFWHADDVGLGGLGVSGLGVTGLGVSGGSVRGSARVLVRADAEALASFEPGEILVCRVTDPSWAPVLSVAAAVVIDTGGPLSHGAIVARELGIPCVINTKRGSTALRTGDLLDVDGDLGEVLVVQRKAVTHP